VVVEMPLCERHVDVARLADRLAVVEGFQHGEETGMLLQEAGERVEVFRALMAGEPRPFREGAGGGLDRGVHILHRALGDLGQRFAGGGVLRGEGLARAGEAAVDEMPEGTGPLSAIQARTSASLSGAGPYSIVSKISRVVILIAPLCRAEGKLQFFGKKSSSSSCRFLEKSASLHHPTGCL
jgi:hypothetical protein